MTDIEFLVKEMDWDEEPVRYNPYDDWSDKRQSDASHCMHLKYTESPKNGRNHWNSQPCNEPDCKICGPRIREEMQKALNKVLKEKPLRKVTLIGTVEEIGKQRAKLMRKYGKDKVSSFANDILTDDGFDVEIEMLIDTIDEIGEEYTETNLEDIERWAQKSFYLNKSGNLHKLRKPAVAGKMDDLDIWDTAGEVEYESWLLNTKDAELLAEIEKQAIEDTRDLLPKSIIELEKAMEIRRKRRKELLKENEIVILSNNTLRMIVKESEIDWSVKEKEKKAL